jgi:hypothetical protein
MDPSNLEQAGRRCGPRGGSRCSPAPASRRRAACRRSRTRTGLWRTVPPEELATPAGVRPRPGAAVGVVRLAPPDDCRCAPNAAHDVLARWSQGGERTTVVTQNVDDLHLKAGTDRLVRPARLHLGAVVLARLPRRARTGLGDERVPMPGLPRCTHCQALRAPLSSGSARCSPRRICGRGAGHPLRRLRDDRHLVGGVSRRRSGGAGAAPRRVHRRDHAEPTPATTVVDLALHAPAEVVLPTIDRLLTLPTANA